MAYGKKRDLFEYWGHEASLLPLTLYPYLKWRMDRARRGIGTYNRIATFAAENRRFVNDVRKSIISDGPVSASSFEGGKGKGSWWGWSDAKLALEYLFWCGDITTSSRRNFERIYDITERVIPPKYYNAPTIREQDAQRHLIQVAARAMGVATLQDLRDYFRLDLADAKARIAELLETGDLIELEVETWTKPAYALPDIRIPRATQTQTKTHALLSPFDSLVWERARARRLFEFDYRLEIYVPPHKRIHGYYVLPFLFGDRLVARVDLKADRQAGVLRMHSAHVEPHAQPEAIEALREDLQSLASWLDLDNVAGKFPATSGGAKRSLVRKRRTVVEKTVD
jgi:uncharacterized protein